jgi:hypothetical protein
MVGCRPKPKFPADRLAAAADAQRKFIGDRISKHYISAVMLARGAGLAFG